MKPFWLALVLPVLAAPGACQNARPEPASSARSAVSVAQETESECIRVRFKPARTVLSIRDDIKGQLFLTSLCSDVRLRTAPTLNRDFFLTAWNDATRTRAKPLVPPYPPGPGPYVHGQYDFVTLRRGDTKAFPISEAANALFSGPGQFTLVGVFTPRSGAPVPEDVLTFEDGPFQRSIVKITVTD